MLNREVLIKTDGILSEIDRLLSMRTMEDRVNAIMDSAAPGYICGRSICGCSASLQDSMFMSSVYVRTPNNQDVWKNPVDDIQLPRTMLYGGSKGADCYSIITEDD